MPCHYSSWMRSSGCPHAEKKNRNKTEAVINGGNIPRVGLCDELKDQRPTLTAKLRPLGSPHMIEFWHDTSRAASA